MRAGALAIASLIAAAALAACTVRGRERITLATVRLPAFGLVFIAQAKGYFAEQGVTVEQRPFSSGRDALGGLLAGEVDAATMFETPVARTAGMQRDLRVVTTLHESSRGTCIVARAGRGIRSGEDLAGRRVGVPLGTHAEFFLHIVLAYSGIPDDAVRMVNVEPERTVEALAKGEVDAIAIWSPHVEKARGALGPSGSVEFAVPVYTEISLLVSREDVLARRRDAFVRFVRALAQAERLVRERPEEAFQALRSELAEIGEPELRDAWRRVQPGLGLTNQLASGLEQQAEWFRARNRVAGPLLDVGLTLRTDVLAEVDLEAITYVSPAGVQVAR